LPANSGAITGTIAHKHSAPSADGGFLDDNVTGVTGTANGSLLMFDGSSIAQDLPSGNLNDVLTMGAAVPAWSPTSSSAVWEQIYDETLIVNGNLQATFSHYDMLQVYIRAANVGAQPTGITFNSTYTGTQYSSHYLTDMNSDEDYASTSSVYINGTQNTSNFWSIWMNIWNLDGEEKTCSWSAMLDQGGGNVNLTTSLGCGKTTFTTDITSIEKVNLSTGIITSQQTGSRITVLGAN
jgi:hypothetical protein